MRHRIRVGVLRGGPSAEYDVSLKTGAAMLKALRENLDDTYEVKDIFIDKSGIWHVDGQPFTPTSAYKHFDVALNALHGTYGEDGKIQHLLESINMPFTGSGSVGSAVGMNKSLTKQILKNQGIKSPYWREVRTVDIEGEIERAAEELFNRFLMPAVIKPNASGSSVGVSVVHNKPEIADALRKASEHGDLILVEEFIPGIESTCGVIEGFRGQDLYALPAIEIRPKTQFFDYDAKYAGQSEEIVPASFPVETRKEIEEMAKKVHQALQLRHYSRTDFIIHPRRGIYVLETNTLPGMTDESLIPKSLNAVGGKLHELLNHLIQLALRQK